MATGKNTTARTVIGIFSLVEPTWCPFYEKKDWIKIILIGIPVFGIGFMLRVTSFGSDTFTGTLIAVGLLVFVYGVCRLVHLYRGEVREARKRAVQLEYHVHGIVVGQSQATMGKHLLVVEPEEVDQCHAVKNLCRVIANSITIRFDKCQFDLYVHWDEDGNHTYDTVSINERESVGIGLDMCSTIEDLRFRYSGDIEASGRSEVIVPFIDRLHEVGLDRTRCRVVFISKLVGADLGGGGAVGAVVGGLVGGLTGAAMGGVVGSLFGGESGTWSQSVVDAIRAREYGDSPVGAAVRYLVADCGWRTAITAIEVNGVVDL